MRDGVHLATDVYLPDGAGPFPTILIRTPYNRTGARMQRKGGFYSSHGFAVVIQDVRGTGASPGKEAFYPWMAERDDGQDTLRWVARQGFCNGKVGTHGGSYLATNQWLAAPDAPECLKCMVAYVGPHSLYHGFYWGGAHYLAITLTYSLVMAGAVDFSGGLEEGWKEMHKRFWHLPLSDADLVEGKHNPMFQDMILRSTYGDYWRMFDSLAEPSRIKVPVLQLCGWFDAYPMQSIRAWEIMRRKAGSKEARSGSKILVGAWSHDRAGSRCRDLDFGPNVCIDLYDYEIRWFKYWLMGIDNGIAAESPLRLFTMGADRWQDFSDWPPPGSEERRLYLHSGGKASSLDGDGLLSWEKPRDESPDKYLYDPMNPVPTVGGNHSCDYARIPAGPMDQREVEKRQDVLVYSSEVLEEPVEIAGPVRVELHAASTARDTDFTAKLVDVQPDGRAINLSEGIVRARGRDSIYERKPIEPGKVYEYTIHLVDLSHVFLHGHRIRLEISSSNFPKYSRNLNTGADSHTTKEVAVAEQTIFHDTRRPSALVVWVR